MTCCSDSVPRIYQGFEFEHALEIQDSDGLPINLTAKTMTSEMRDTVGGTLEATFTVEAVTLASGLINITLNAAGTAACDVGRYYFDVVFVEAGVATLVTPKQEILVVDTVTAPA